MAAILFLCTFWFLFDLPSMVCPFFSNSFCFIFLAKKNKQSEKIYAFWPIIRSLSERGFSIKCCHGESAHTNRTIETDTTCIFASFIRISLMSFSLPGLYIQGGGGGLWGTFNMKAVDTHQIIWLLLSKELSHIFGNQTYKITLYSSTMWREVAKDHWLLKGTLQRF